MSVLEPTLLETVDYAAPGWSNIVTTNIQRLNNIVNRTALIIRQADTSVSLPPNTATRAFVIVTTAGSGAVIGDLLFDNGTASWDMVIIPKEHDRWVAVVGALSGGTVEFDALSVYAWNNNTSTWIKTADVGGGGSGTLPATFLYRANLINNPTNPLYQIDIGVGRMRSSDDTADIIVASIKTPDITASGKNGLDAGSEASNTWYHVFAILNPGTTEVAGLFSTSKTSPTLPAGFTKFRRVGQARNDSGSDFLDFKQVGHTGWREVNYFEAKNVLTGGAATSYTNVDCSAFIPAENEKINLNVVSGNQGTEVRVNTKAAGNQIDIGSNANNYHEIFTNHNNIIQYQNKLGGGSTDINVYGFIECLE